MRAYDIIKSKRDGNILSSSEIEFFINGYCSGEISDEQVAAFLMAVYFRGMNIDETHALTQSIINSGSVADLSLIDGIKVDKHSTGGVGDKTTLIVIPIVASCGVKVAKLSGRGLGHTGGTIDKLESIQGFRTSFSKAEFAEIVNNIGAGIAGQSSDLAPADKKLYALRDVTATVDEPSLIASSIMSKKLASGADKILLDVKVGSGAFNKTEEQGRKLARIMTDIGKKSGKQTIAILTDMDKPLGNAIGNALELKEAIETLKGNGPSDLVKVCVTLAGYMLYMAKPDNLDNCLKLAEDALYSGNALCKFKQIIAAQGGDPACCDDYSLLPLTTTGTLYKANISGYISMVNCEAYGLAASALGAGRNKKEDTIDHSAGIYLYKKPGDYVQIGDTIAVLYGAANKTQQAIKILESSTFISDNKPKDAPIIIDVVE